MSKFIGLLVREWREHANGFIWAPSAILIVLLLVCVGAMFLSPEVEGEMSQSERYDLEQRLNAQDPDDLSGLEMLAAMTLDVAGSTDAELQEKLSKLLAGVATPFNLVFLLLAFFTLLGCLYDERKDQSILFWKSMPVTDAQTVLSKWVFVSWVAPLVTIVAICLAQFVVVLLVSSNVEEGMGGRIWSASQLWLRPFETLLHYVFLSFWLLPVGAWIMFVSAWVKRLPMLFVLGIPWLLILLERLFLGSSSISALIGRHFSQMVQTSTSSSVDVLAALSATSYMTFWLGIVLGLVFLSASIWCRQRINEG
jgi:ABC-2 type transport system permease protein